MTAVQELAACADIAETMERHELAQFWRGMAEDAGQFPALYQTWADMARDYVATRLMPVKGDGE